MLLGLVAQPAERLVQVFLVLPSTLQDSLLCLQPQDIGVADAPWQDSLQHRVDVGYKINTMDGPRPCGADRLQCIPPRLGVLPVNSTVGCFGLR